MKKVFKCFLITILLVLFTYQSWRTINKYQASRTSLQVSQYLKYDIDFIPIMSIFSVYVNIPHGGKFLTRGDSVGLWQHSVPLCDGVQGPDVHQVRGSLPHPPVRLRGGGGGWTLVQGENPLQVQAGAGPHYQDGGGLQHLPLHDCQRTPGRRGLLLPCQVIRPDLTF